MKNKTSGTLSGCLIWLLLISILSICIVPAFSIVGSVTSFSQSAIALTGKFLCPAETTPEAYAYKTSMLNDNGQEQPATAIELHCVDEKGTVIKNDPVVYAFLWVGVFALIGLIISGILAQMLATPTGVFITRLLNRRKKQDIPTNLKDE